MSLRCLFLGHLWKPLPIAPIDPAKDPPDLKSLRIEHQCVRCGRTKALDQGGSWAVLLPGDRASHWQRILGTHELPVVSPVPEKMLIKGAVDVPAYQLDLNRVSPAAQRRIAAWLSVTTSQPIEDVEHEMKYSGVPIYAEGCTLVRTA